VLWTAPVGVRCVMARYDETRFQLRLLADGGTIKTDLCIDYAEAMRLAREWRRHIEHAYPRSRALGR
jgi:hypothetical protein